MTPSPPCSLLLQALTSASGNAAVAAAEQAAAQRQPQALRVAVDNSSASTGDLEEALVHAGSAADAGNGGSSRDDAQWMEVLSQCQREASGSLDDVAGLEDVKEDIIEAVMMPLQYPELWVAAALSDDRRRTSPAVGPAAARAFKAGAAWDARVNVDEGCCACSGHQGCLTALPPPLLLQVQGHQEASKVGGCLSRCPRQQDAGD